MNIEDEIPQGSVLIVDGCHGVFVPQRFAQTVDHRNVLNVTEHDWKILGEGPDNEDYWDCWNEVESDARIHLDGKEYFLHQDGDLWMIPIEEV